MDDILEKLNDILDANEEIEGIRNELIEVKNNIIEALEALNPINGVDDVMEDVDLLIQKINGDMDW